MVKVILKVLFGAGLTAFVFYAIYIIALLNTLAQFASCFRP